jgi:hypothetical protein
MGTRGNLRRARRAALLGVTARVLIAVAAMRGECGRGRRRAAVPSSHVAGTLPSGLSVHASPGSRQGHAHDSGHLNLHRSSRRQQWQILDPTVHHPGAAVSGRTQTG